MLSISVPRGGISGYPWPKSRSGGPAHMIGGHLEQDRDRDGKRFWRIRLDYGIDPVSGKREQPRDPGIWYDVREARRRLAERTHEANHGPRIDPTKQTISTIVNSWLDQEAIE